MKSLMFIAGAAVFAASVATGAPASARPKVIPSPTNPEMVQTTVFLGDLDLGRPAGAKAAVKRMRVAARAVCGEPMSTFPLALQTSYRACVTKSLDAAVGAVDLPLVWQAHGLKPPVLYAAR